MKKKKYLYIVSGTVIFLSVVLAVFLVNTTAALNVNDVAADPAAFTGTITITGVVAGVSQQDPAIIGMMDKKELRCTTPNCNKFYLPFKAENYAPVPGEEVRVTGRFETKTGGVLFIADSVKVVRKHNIGG